MFGMIIGSSIGVKTADKFGRVNTIKYSSLFGIIFGVLNCILDNFWLSTIDRVLLGVAGGYYSSVCPLYSSEIVTQDKRGFVGGLMSFASSIGFIAAV